ncbi:MAG TPA: hypothetical protein PLQ45_00655 [Anaerohalosphaeraceae bacterium]|jgi:hypothetical protein|nr:hypothetical protein [Anaerohalosphaeraceae bacterium]
MKPRSSVDHSLWLLLVGIAAWAVPGGGHFLIGQRKHAAVLFVTIALTFAAGLYIGSIGIIDSVGAKPWYMAQILTSPAVGLLGQIAQKGEYPVYGHPADYAQIYTALAGLLNLLCILNAVYRAYSGIGETIGHEEPPHA